ncbi:MFS transporter [Paenibacillus thalictri]|uniref:MFS transporter n=1 Tax=Paenibacillus thalictri TaxID=2527873 RepID=A0A4Q9DK76_9BACL|nr:MFS transporter [Paenibacillus thalictri]TBL72462.1 MFS transporter [Paenibacillus thalictri]
MKTEYKYLRENIRNSLWNGIAWSIGFNFVNPFIGVLAAQLGATNSDYALLSSIPALLTILLTLPASLVLARFRRQKRIVGVTILVCRFFYFLLVFVPWLGFSQVSALILLVGLYSATNMIISVAWQAMMGEIIPGEFRNQVFSGRNLWTGFTGMVVAFIAGWGIDRFPYPFGYQLAFSIGFLAALVEVWYFLKLRIPSEEQQEDQQTNSITANGQTEPSRAGTHRSQPDRGNSPLRSLWKGFISTYKLNVNAPYYLFCIAAIVFTFTWQAAWPVYLKVKVDLLHATNTMISINTIAGAIGALIGYRLWARIADRKGTAWTVFYSSFSLALTPFCWIFAPNMIWVNLYDFIGGVATAGFQQAVFNRLLEVTPSEGRQKALAAYTTLSQVSAVFAPIAGMQLFSTVSYDLCMFLIGGARILGSVCFLVILSRFIAKRIAANHRNRTAQNPHANV